MPLTTACTECGGNITLSDEMVQEALDMKVPLIAKHVNPPGCPDREAVIHRKFKVRISVFEIHDVPEGETGTEATEELIAQVGGSAEGETFVEAVPNLLKELNKGWDKVAEMASVVDGGSQLPKPSAISGLILPPHG